MGAQLFFSFVFASAILILIPGPNVGLIVSNSLRHGTRAGLSTVTGTTLGIVCQLGFVCLGMASLLGLLVGWFEWVRWAGVAYLILLGLRQFLSKSGEDLKDPSHPSGRRWMLQGLFIALANPKTMLFFAAFLPQFVNPDKPVTRQLALLSLTFALMAWVFDSGYALLAGRVQSAVSRSGRSVSFQKLGGLILIGAGVGLGMARVRR
ncbi:MAG: LysE family translocator [Candidatus Omnitrophica bacterium]|nr:LysE family translocator [Candidatus Omnitrophota bacterium]MCB9783207.1 LysE family translocator [Candidatus Omnitrophota bacterium]